MNAPPRTSVVAELFIASVASASIVLVGDGRIADNRSRAIAVKREYPVYRGDEGSFRRYPLFRAAIPSPVSLAAADVAFVPERSVVRVGRIDVLAASTSAVVQIGSNGRIDNEARQKQFRQVLPETAAAQEAAPETGE